jgi:large subunit ribosomal protein L10
MAVRAKNVQPAKVEAIAQAKTIFENYSDYIFANYRGLTVAQITELRNKLSEKNAAFKVIKNNFARVAFESMKIDNVAEYLKGPTAIALGKEDMNEVAKILVEFQKDKPALVLKAGLIDNEIYDLAQLVAYSKLPGKKQLMAMIAMTINAPIQKLAATLQAAVDKRREQEAADADKLFAVAAPVKETKTPVEESSVEEKSAE